MSLNFMEKADMPNVLIADTQTNTLCILMMEAKKCLKKWMIIKKGNTRDIEIYE